MKEELKEEFITFLSRAQRYCSLNEKCEDDVQKKLKEWKAHPSLFTAILNDLKKEKYIDEERYVKAFARDKFRFSKWGKIKIAYALKGKKISDENIQKGLDAVDQNDYSDFIEKEVKLKFASVKGKDDFEKKGKTLRYMAGKGFELELCQKFLEHNV